MAEPGSAQFVHLHVHTHYSLLDGALKVDKLINRAAEFGMPAVAMTDHGNMHGAVEFYTKANSAGVKPILGCEVYVAPGARTDKTAKADGNYYYHLVLLAENETGYANLVKVVSDGSLTGFYYKPRTDLDFLAKHTEGLIALSACLKGEVPYTLLRQGEAKAKEAAGRMNDMFGPGNFFIEIQDAGIPEQRQVNPGLLKIAKDLDIPAVVTNDCHYLDRADAKAHEVLLAIQTGKTMADDKRMKMETDLLYFRSPEEMIEQFRFQPELCKNSLAIAERCAVKLDLKSHHFPEYPFLKERKADDVVRQQAREGLERRLKRHKIPEEKHDEYRKRLEYELDVIIKMGFPGYFLVVSDFITWAKEKNIPVGPGRGSAAGSVAAWAMKITDLDPIRYGLLFERFLNVERVSMPDIDVDFCFQQRDKVIEYVSGLYGSDKVAQITTFGTLKAKAVIRDVGRALGMTYGEVDKIAKLVPDQLKMTLAKALKEEPRLAELREKDSRIDELLSLAERLEGLHRHASTHAAGVVIAPGALTDYLPLYQDQKTGKVVTQFDMKCTEKVGLIKFDFLGLRTLTVIDQAVRLIKRNHDPEFDIELVPMTDEATFQLFSQGDTTGVFQFESSGMRDMLVKFKPDRFEHLIALVALYRPGPMENIPEYIERKFGRKKVVYPHPDLADILEETYGIIVYQEQVMAVANELAGYSLGQADILRRAMGKKIVEVMEEERGKFVSGAKERGHDEKLANDIFDLLAKFAGYGFNKSHAAAYALIAYQTGFLKAHYPAEFMAAQLTSVSTDSDKVMVQIAECKAMGLEMLPPDVNASDNDFGVDQGAVRFGLAGVKNVGGGAIEAIVQAREEDGPFTDLFDFCRRVDLSRVNRRVMESLIKCGAFDSLSNNRAQLMAGLDGAVEEAQRAQKEKEAGQFNLFDGEGAELDPGPARSLPDVDEWPETTRLEFEKEAIGFYVSGHPLDQVADQMRRFTDCSLASLADRPDKSKVRVGGLVVGRKEINTKKGDRMAFVTLEDLSGRMEIVFFPRVYLESRPLFEAEEPVLISGTLQQGENDPSLKAEEVIPLTQAVEKLQKELRIFVDLSRKDEEDLRNLRGLLAGRPGPASVILMLRQPGRFVAEMKAREMGVQPSHDLFDQIEDILGTGCLV